MAATVGTIVCTLCDEPIRVTFTRRTPAQDGAVLLELDTAPLIEHMRTCKCADRTHAGEAPPAPAAGGLVRRPTGPAVKAAPPVPRFVAPGRRSCIAGGAHAPVCLQRLQGSDGACCGACADGDTHPVPGASMPCQVWAADHGPQD